MHQMVHGKQIMSLTIEEVHHIARLARLQITEEEAERYRVQIGSILEYVAKLQSLDTEGVPELAHGSGLSNVWRTDEVTSSDKINRASFLEAFPHREGDLLQVQAVFEERTE
ncbi:MAG: Aspartyl/glutamyl-tRNA(Asn/Gln) amidotransferase subunit C [Candidatus Uhrbacteria bacterium GW2011_GWF2_41_16]|uniref:Aspartyl/glutamyl-tRNA(Asn/Gln) amidotransferase subunit C n=2 Tax=Candidatus Uhriibacteriota TaxID=1752732 RepID=A0A0G0YD22_9BACT|nr:MAG: Aspartyl/glutamyl-tRNA(Asn/Gln) amidotransferase subunit C [Candidatus Uhrbacteria bacterium GW2011_GWF2_41_16]